MRARGAKVYGIDLERPLLAADIGTVFRIAWENGAERAIKSVSRYLLYDRGERAAFETAFRCSFDDIVTRVEFRVGDASTADAWSLIPFDLDLIYSEDVFEHIPEASLGGVLKCMNAHIRQDGLILIRPNIWTGITGGHFVEWYPTNIDDPGPKRRLPWSHLTTGLGESSVYLNKMRLGAYTAEFSKWFDIIEVVNCEYGLGSDRLTEDIVDRLPTTFSRDELLTNRVLFVMKPHV
jgi:hypothetical protein